jgi:hypothetical protein
MEVKLTTHLHQVLRSRMTKLHLHSPHMPSWHSRDNFTLPFTQIFSSYLTENAMHLHSKDHLANAV